MNDYLQFEIEKAKKKDNKCYCTDEVPFLNNTPMNKKDQKIGFNNVQSSESLTDDLGLYDIWLSEILYNYQCAILPYC